MSAAQGLQALETAAREIGALEQEVESLKADRDHYQAIDQAELRGRNDFWDGKALKENPYHQNWDAKSGSPEWREHLQHSVWEDAWRRGMELQLLQEIALVVKTWLVADWSETHHEENVRHFVEKYEGSNCTMPDGWPSEEADE